VLPIYDRLTGEQVKGELLRSQEFRTERCPYYVARGVIEVGTQIREVRVRREPDMHGNYRVSEQRYQVDFDTALGSLKVQLKWEGNVTEVMPEYVKHVSR